jgi:hypothetical protein
MGSPKKLLSILVALPARALRESRHTGKVEGVVNGYVTDAVTKKPLSGVVVSATVPGTNNQTGSAHR